MLSTIERYSVCGLWLDSIEKRGVAISRDNIYGSKDYYVL
jgi:hypothetical protein